MADGDPVLTWYLALRPSSLEMQLRNSPVYRRQAAFLDWWFCVYTIGANVIMVYWLDRARGMVKGFQLFQLPAVVWIAAATAQACFWYKDHRRYMAWRSTIIMCNRLARLLVFAAIALWTARTAAAPSGLAALRAFYSRTLAWPSRAGLRRSLFIVSHANLSFAHAIHLPLPFLSETAFHAAYLALMLAASLPAAQVVLDLPHLRPEIAHTCAGLEDWMQAFESSILLMTPPPPHLRTTSLCRACSLPLLLLFVALYGGVLLPLYISYRLDLTVKAWFLRDLLASRGRVVAAGHHLPWWRALPGLWCAYVTVWDALVVLMLGVLSWSLSGTLCLLPVTHRLCGCRGW